MAYIRKITLIILVIFTVSILNCGLIKPDGTGITKVAGSIALKEDGSIWEIPMFDNKEYKKIAEGFVNIDADLEGTSYAAVKKDGTLWVWGTNNMGQFAENNQKKSYGPIKIMDDVKTVSGLAALKKDGTVWTWGGDKFYNASLKVNKPIMVYKGAKAIAYGYNFIYIIDNNGVLYAVANPNSEMSKELKNKKIKISENVKFVNMNCFIKSDKSLWNFSFDNETNIKTVQVLKNVKYADSNYVSKCAIKEDGTLWVWEFEDDNIPDVIEGYGKKPQKIMSGVRYAECGIQSVVAVKNDGSLCALGAVCPKTNYSIPKSVMKNVKKVYDNGWVLTQDNTLWRIEYYLNDAQKTKITDNVKSVSEDYIIEKSDGTTWHYFSDYSTNTFTLKEYKDKFAATYHELRLSDDGDLYIEKLDENTGERIFEKILNFTGKIKKFYSNNHFVFVIKDDDSLWVALKDEDTIYSPETLKKYAKPVKILDDAKEFNSVGNYGFAISNKGELWAWRIDPFNHLNSQEPKKVMDNVESFDDQKYSLIDVIKKDKSHWYFSSIDFAWDDAKENFAEVMSKSAVKDIDNMEDIRVHNSNLYIKNNGELWVRGFMYEDNDGNSAAFTKVMENVKYAEYNNTYGIAISTDGSLWEFGKIYNPAIDNDFKVNSESLKPRKLLDKVKEIRLNFCNTALCEDGSFYTWGENGSGQLGNDSTEFCEKPQKVLNDVVWSNSGVYDTSVLKKDGTLLHWGCGFAIGHERPYVKNPMNLGLENGNKKIQHLNYESVGTNEDIEVLAKITDPAYKNDVRLILGSGEEIPMEMTADSYYNAVIPGNKNLGIISYRINASDGKGNSITSNEYKVEVVSNEIVLIDSQNDEVNEADMKIVVNGKLLFTDTKPVIKQGRSMIPVRAITEALDADVKWEEKTRTVFIKKGSKEIRFKVGEKVITVDNKEVKIDVPAVIVNERTLLPVRALGEALGAQVNWDEKDKRVEIVLEDVA